MRIWTRVVIEPDGSLNKEESVYEEYDGPIAECKGGVTVPGPSAEEKALQAQQTDILKQQQAIIERQVRQQELLSPILFEEAGIIPETDPQTGEITGFTIDPEAAARRADRQEIEDLFLERTGAALRGELPINPALERELQQGELDIRERLRKQLGPGFETSTPGIEALDTFFRSSEDLREGARRGDLTLAEQLGLAREQGNEAGLDNSLRRILGINQSPFAAIQPFSNTLSGLHNVEGSLAAQRQLQTQGSIASAQARASTLGSLFGAIGTGAGIGAGIIFSSRHVKHNQMDIDVDAILAAIDRLPVHRWEYVNGAGPPGVHIGPYADDFREVMGVGDPDDLGIYPVDGIGVLIAAVKALANRVRELEDNNAS